jgi:hypothetical protein
MRKLTVILTLFLFSVSSLFANSVQVFTTNTMHLTIDKNKEIVNVFSGEKEDFLKNASSILDTSIVKEGAANAALSGTAAAAAQQSFKGLDANGGLVGVAVIASITAGILAYDYISKSKLFNDYEYLYIAKAKDNKDKETLIYSYIISKSELSSEEIKNTVMKDL